MIDESIYDGIDNDGDWNPETDDIGEDGVDGTSDLGEGDGLTTLGEPNFEFTDKDEKDQLGLQSAYIASINDKGPTGAWPKNDNVIWEKMTGGFSNLAGGTNIMMISACGPFSLKKWRRERFAVAVICGDNLEDIILNKTNTQILYNNNFNFSSLPNSMESGNYNIPAKYLLSQNYPNPFNPSTVISYQLPVQSHVSLVVFNMLGQEIAALVNEEKPAGSYEVEFDASGLSSGTYFYQIRAGNFVETKKLVLLK